MNKMRRRGLLRVVKPEQLLKKAAIAIDTYITCSWTACEWMCIMITFNARTPVDALIIHVIEPRYM